MAAVASSQAARGGTNAAAMRTLGSRRAADHSVARTTGTS